MLKETPILPGYYVVIGWRTYSRCPECDKIVWVNKPFLGSWGGIHLCLSDVAHAWRRFLEARREALDAVVEVREQGYVKMRGRVLE